jgi:hypothetical protein
MLQVAEPQKILLAIPCMDYKQYTLNVMGMVSVLAASGGLVQPYWLNGNSDIRAARNEIAHYFINRTDCDTLFFLDSDITFTLRDYAWMMEGEEDIVIAPYARKSLGAPPVKVGMGFCRIARRVFERLNDWQDTDGSECLRRYYKDGEIATDFFVNGATVDSQWLGEDSGFWHLCRLATDISVRFETRTELGHCGMFVYGYPDQLKGQAAFTTTLLTAPIDD